MTTLLLSEKDVQALLPVADCIDVMADALRRVTLGDATLPLRTVLRLDGTPNAFATMPAVLGTGTAASLGAKVLTVFPGNDATPFDSHIGVVLLFDAEHGSLQAIADASSITAIRTSAVSGLATRLLAVEDAHELTVLGAGVLAPPHIDAICAVRPIRRVRIWSRSGTAPSGRAQVLASQVRARHSIEVAVCASAQEAVHAAQVICTLTSSRTPVLEGAWLAPGAHVNAVGASLASARELDSEAIRRARFFVDRRESTLAESGDFLIPRAEGVVNDAHILGELGELLVGTMTGRTDLMQVTVFKSLGLAVEDVAALRHILTRALATGAGVAVELGGKRA